MTDEQLEGLKAEIPLDWTLRKDGRWSVEAKDVSLTCFESLEVPGKWLFGGGIVGLPRFYASGDSPQQAAAQWKFRLWPYLSPDKASEAFDALGLKGGE